MQPVDEWVGRSEKVVDVRSRVETSVGNSV